MSLLHLFLWGSIFLSEMALACASCGSGGGNPLVLYPNESQKLLFGLSRQSNINEIKSNGDEYSPNLRHRDQTLIAGGVQFKRRYQVAFSLPYVTNRTADGRQYSGLGYYAFGFKYTALQQTFMEPNRPQIQLLLDHKPIHAKSVFDYERLDGLDITGSGLVTTTLGIDLWWGMRALMFGGLLSSTYNQQREIEERSVTRGTANTIAGTLGYLVNSKNLVTTGVSVTRKMSDQDNDRKVADSESSRGDVFLALRYKPIPLEEWRISYRVNGARFFKNYNTTRQVSVSASYAKVL